MSFSAHFWKEKKKKYLTLLDFCTKICQREEVAAL